MRLVKLSLTPIAFLLLFTTLLGAADRVGTVTFSQSDLSFSTKAGFDVIEMNEADQLLIPGSPNVPCRRINVALPDGAAVTGLTVIRTDTVELPGTYDLIPSARVRRISNPAQTNPFIKDLAVYGADAAYPGLWAEQGAEWDLVGQQFVTVDLYPVQYNPVSGKLFLATSISWEVSYTVDPQHVRQTYNFSDVVRAGYEAQLKSMAVNPGAVAPIPSFTGPSTRALPAGDYEYVIIAYANYEAQFQPLADYYTQIGIPARVCTLSYLSSYSYSNTSTGIQNFVRDAHSTWGTIYFLIGGDKSKVAYHTRSLGGDSIPNDTAYADYDNDWKCEVYLGRAPVDSTTEATRFVNKSLDYMTNPPSGFGEEVFQMGFDLDSYTDGEDLMINIYNNYVPSGTTYSREYDSESSSHKSDCRNYINAGQSVTNHCDHCYHNSLGVGTYNHGDDFDNGDAQGFTNGAREGVLYTLGCWPGAFDYSECWGEYFVKSTSGGGAAFVGNSRYGWYSPGSVSSYSCAYDKNFFKRLWGSHDYRVGVTLGASKNASATGDSTYKYIFTELNIQGDPAMPIWTAVPSSLSCTHDSQISTGYQSFTVNVKRGSTNVYGALVCVYKDTEVYARATTDYSGNATFNIDPATAGTMSVCATGENFLPYVGSTTVTSGPPPTVDIELTLDKTDYARGAKIVYDIVVDNNQATSFSGDVWTNITLPNQSVYPASGYLDGPFSLTWMGYERKSGTLKLKIPLSAPLATMTFNAFVGSNPGIDDEDHVTFSIIW